MRPSTINFKGWGLDVLSSIMFNDSDLRKNFRGVSIAHILARYNALPKGFNQWHLSTPDGWTVAHTLAQYGHHFPSSFSGWEMVDIHGTSVKDIYLQNSRN